MPGYKVFLYNIAKNEAKYARLYKIHLQYNNKALAQCVQSHCTRKPQ